jgi:hypothetical protein
MDLFREFPQLFVDRDGQMGRSDGAPLFPQTGMNQPERKALAEMIDELRLGLISRATGGTTNAERYREIRKTSYGWPLIIGGTPKAAYDLVLLAQFRKVAPREEGIR